MIDSRLTRVRERAVIAAVVAGMLVVSGARPGAGTGDGTLDPTFGSGGILVRDFGNSEDFLDDIAVQDDGRIVGVGIGASPTKRLLVRFRVDGSLDPTFGITGIVTTSSKVRFDKVALQPDGKIILAGGGIQIGGSAIARHHADGSLDQSFGTGGIAIINLGQDSFFGTAGVAVRADGKIVVASRVIRRAIPRPGVVTIRVNSDGSLDTSFNETGRVTQAIDSFGFSAFSAVAVQPDDKIVVAEGDRRGYVLFRYDNDGSLDSSFNGTGLLSDRVPDVSDTTQAVSGLVIQPDGALVIAILPASGDFTMVRYRSDGSRDPTFGVDGVKTGPEGGSTAIALQSDGRILVAGISSDKAGNGLRLARFNVDGSEDVTFGTNGLSDVRFSTTRVEFRATPLRVQQDGRVVLGATLAQASFALPPFHEWILMRFDASASAP